MNNEDKKNNQLDEEYKDTIECNDCNEDGKTNDEVDSNLDAAKEELKEDKEISYKEKYEDKVKELEELNNRYLRLQADFSNYKRRTTKEKENIYSYANVELMTEFLGIIDNFERAFVVDDEEIKKNSFYQGMEMIYKQFMDILEKNGLEEIEAIGKNFDPNIHHAVMQEESENCEENIVTDVFQKGYKLKDKVIRPSMVKVSK